MLVRPIGAPKLSLAQKSVCCTHNVYYVKDKVGIQRKGALTSRWRIVAARPHLHRLSEPLRPLESTQSPIEGTEWQVSGLARHFEHQAVGKPERRPNAKLLDGPRNDLGILYREVLMIEQHLDRGRELRRCALVHRIQHPKRLGQDQVRYPRAGRNEFLGSRDLRGIVTHDESHQQVRINRAHAVDECTCEPPP